MPGAGGSECCICSKSKGKNDLNTKEGRDWSNTRKSDTNVKNNGEECIAKSERKTATPGISPLDRHVAPHDEFATPGPRTMDEKRGMLGVPLESDGVSEREEN